MEKLILQLLACASLVTAQFNVTRQETGDKFVWSGLKIDCIVFSKGTAMRSGNGDACECKDASTFSTQSSTCTSYTDEGEEL